MNDEVSELLGELNLFPVEGPNPDWDCHPRVYLVLEIGRLLNSNTEFN